MPELAYTPLERLRVRRAVDRLAYLRELCRGRRVLDLGCYDETAVGHKQGTRHWLHGEIARVAASVVGVDSAEALPADGLATGPTSRIVRGDVMRLDGVVDPAAVDVIVAGELIEHLPDTLAFLHGLRDRFPGRELVMTTPNATSLTNGLLALAGRENNHPDHLQIYSFKTLNTLCLRAGFAEWEIRPYYMYYTEMILRSGPVAGAAVRAAQAVVNAAEAVFPLLGGGLVCHVRRI